MKIQNALVSNILDRSQRCFAQVTTVTLSWRVQNIVVIGRLYFTLECFEFSSNFEFDRNMLSGTGARCLLSQRFTRFDTIKSKAHRQEVAQTFRLCHARTTEYECEHLIPCQNARSFIADDHISHIRIKFPKFSTTYTRYKHYVEDFNHD